MTAPIGSAFNATIAVQSNERLKRLKWLRPIIICGQNSLGIFATGIVLTVACVLAMARLGGGYPVYIATAIFGLTVHGLTGELLQWMKSEPWRPTQRRTAA